MQVQGDWETGYCVRRHGTQMERFLATLKTDLIHHEQFITKKDAILERLD